MQMAVEICQTQAVNEEITSKYSKITAMLGLLFQTFEPCHEKTCLCHMRTTKAQISLISAFIVRCLYSIIHLISISEISSLCLASATAQAGLSLPWSQIPKTGFLVTRLILFSQIFCSDGNNGEN